MLVADRAGHALQAGHVAQDPLADRRVPAHDCPLPGVQRAGLAQDLVGHPDLPDVMQERDRLGLRGRRLREAQSLGDPAHQCQGLLAVPARVAVAGLQGGTEGDEAGPVLGGDLALVVARHVQQARVLTVHQPPPRVADDQEGHQQREHRRRHRAPGDDQGDQERRGQRVADHQAG